MKFFQGIFKVPLLFLLIDSVFSFFSLFLQDFKYLFVLEGHCEFLVQFLTQVPATCHFSARHSVCFVLI